MQFYLPEDNRKIYELTLVIKSTLIELNQLKDAISGQHIVSATLSMNLKQ